jgi:LacI family transcriptional regulator
LGDTSIDLLSMPDPMPSSVTITQIADAAGVSTATVDRVLNNRPGVNPVTVHKVREALAALGGGAPVRGRPRSTSNYRFCFVLPATRRGFFDLVDRVIAQAAGDFRHQHITEITHRVPVVDASACAAEILALGEMDGVALLAPDVPPVKLAINELVRAGVHVVTLFSDVAGSMRETHVGADNRAAGRTAGLLLGRMCGAGARDTLLLSSQATRLSAEIERRIGFAQVIEERFAKIKVQRTPDLPGSDAGACRALLRFLRGNGSDLARVAGIYNVGSGSAGVARAIESLGLTGSVPVVVHDLTDEHRALLAANGLAYVLHQDIHYCISTAARVLRALCENVRGALNVVQPRVEILTAENLH